MPITIDVLIDTNVLLRTQFDKPIHTTNATRAIVALRRQNMSLATTTQNMAEFWNVSTRPDDPASNGYGLSMAETFLRIQRFERLFTILAESPRSYGIWKQLVVEHSIKGKQVHDARLAAMMLAYSIPTILTFNEKDFRRYKGINPSIRTKCWEHSARRAS